MKDNAQKEAGEFNRIFEEAYDKLLDIDSDDDADKAVELAYKEALDHCIANNLVQQVAIGLGWDDRGSKADFMRGLRYLVGKGREKPAIKIIRKRAMREANEYYRRLKAANDHERTKKNIRPDVDEAWERRIHELRTIALEYLGAYLKFLADLGKQQEVEKVRALIAHVESGQMQRTH